MLLGNGTGNASTSTATHGQLMVNCTPETFFALASAFCSVKEYDRDLIRVLDYTCIVCGALSVLGAAFVIVTFAIFKDLRVQSLQLVMCVQAGVRVRGRHRCRVRPHIEVCVDVLARCRQRKINIDPQVPGLYGFAHQRDVHIRQRAQPRPADVRPVPDMLCAGEDVRACVCACMSK